MRSAQASCLEHVLKHVMSPWKETAEYASSNTQIGAEAAQGFSATLSHRGATPDSDRARRPALSQPPASGEELTRGEFGTVQRSNEDEAEVKWDDDGWVRVRQPSLRKTRKVDEKPGKSKKRSASSCALLRKLVLPSPGTLPS